MSTFQRDEDVKLGKAYTRMNIGDTSDTNDVQDFLNFFNDGVHQDLYVRPDSPESVSVKVAAAEIIKTDGSRLSFAEATLSMDGGWATGTNYNKVAMSFNLSDGTVTRTAGTENAVLGSVVEPVMPAGEVPIAMVTIQGNGGGSINNVVAADIEDLRQSVSSVGGGTGGGVNFEELGTAEGAKVGDLVSGQSAVFGASGVISGTLSISTTAADVIRGDKVFKYVMGAATDWFGRTVDIPQGYRGRELNITFEYKYNGDDDDVNFVVRDETNDVILSTVPMSAFAGLDNIATRYQGSFNCPSDAAQITYGFQTVTANASKELIWDDVVINGELAVVQGTAVFSKTISTASSGSFSSGVAGTPFIEAWFWDNSAATYDLLSGPSFSISSDGTGVISYDFTSLTFDASDFVVVLVKGGTVIATAANEYDSGWVTVSAINDTLKGASVTNYHEVTLPGGFTDYPAGITVLYDDGTDVSAADYASVTVLSKNATGGVRVAIDTTGWAGTDKFRLYCSKSARPVGNETYVVQDYTAIGTVGSASQQAAGHQFALTEPGTASSDVLALYYFGANGDAITQDETGTYTLSATNLTDADKDAGLFGGSSGSINFDGSTEYFSQATLLDTFPSALAVDCWFKMPDGQPSGSMILFEKDNGPSNNNTYVRIETSGQIRFQANSGTSTSIYSTTVLPNAATDWIYLCINWDTVNGMRMWVNGTLESANSGYTTLLSNGTTSDFQIGALTGPFNYFSGQVAYFRVRNKTLTQKDVDIAYATTYTWDSPTALDDAVITAYTQEDGNADFKAQYKGDFEVARFNNKIYRYGNGSDALNLSSTTKFKIVGRQ